MCCNARFEQHCLFVTLLYGCLEAIPFVWDLNIILCVWEMLDAGSVGLLLAWLLVRVDIATSGGNGSSRQQQSSVHFVFGVVPWLAFVACSTSPLLGGVMTRMAVSWLQRAYRHISFILDSNR